jgi:hypothetical protein
MPLLLCPRSYSSRAGMALDSQHLALYGALRAQFLERFFSFGRYFRTNYLCLWNHLGSLHAPGSTASDITDDLKVSGATASTVRPASIYPDLFHLRALPPDKQEVERWRVGWHERENPLMRTGDLLTCLAVEYYLGLQDSLPIIKQVLYTLAELYKFPNDQDGRAMFSGYILRWDAVTSDKWTTVPDSGRPKPIYCNNFVLDSKAQYLYSIPFDHPAYVPPAPDWSNDPKIQNPTPAQAAAIAARNASMILYRFPEPSFDELVGLVAGYDITHRLVDDPSVRQIIQEQADRLGNYLAESGYMLVRPGGGFTLRGSAGVGPALEFCLNQAFNRMTGNNYSSRANFASSCDKAGIWQKQLGPALVGWQVLGWTVGVLTGLAAWPLTMLAAAITVLAQSDVFFLLTLILAVGPISGYAACVAIGILDNLRYFDVEDKELAQEFAIAYLLTRCFPFASERFSAAMHWFAAGYGVWARGFCPYLGLTALDAASGSAAAAVADLYLRWFDQGARRSVTTEQGFAQSAIARAVALNLGKTSAAPNVRSFLDDRYTDFNGAWDTQISLDDRDGVTLEVIKNPSVKEEQEDALDYMTTLALSWLYAKKKADADHAAGLPASDPGVPALPPNSGPLPTPSISANVLTSGVSPALASTQVVADTSLFPPRQSPADTRPPDPPPQIPPPAQTDQYPFTVYESDRDVDTGIGISEFDQVTVSASGTIWAGAAFSGRNGPNGWTDLTTNSNYPLHVGTSAHRYALLWKLTDPLNLSDPNAPYHFLGTGSDAQGNSNVYIHAGPVRRIILRINDDDPGNGNGSFTGTITVVRAS